MPDLGSGLSRLLGSQRLPCYAAGRDGLQRCRGGMVMGGIVIVELSIFSGLPDPVLSLGQDAEATLVRLLAAAIGREPARFAEPPGLGYRGFNVTAVSGEPGLPPFCRVFAGTISVPAGTGGTEDWSDTEGAEQFLIDQARALGLGGRLPGASA